MCEKAHLATFAILTAFAVSGCTTTGEDVVSKQTLGTVVGAVGGALLGSQVGGGSGRKIAILVGGLAGGALGNVIGARLDDRDRQALAISTQQALDSGKPVAWQSTHSGATATITPLATRTVTRSATVTRSPGIASSDNLAVINQPYRALKGANLRSGPSVNAAKVGGFAAGQTFTALGRTDNDWISVGRKGLTVGYVHGSLVGPVADASKEHVTDLDSITVAAANQQGFDLDTIAPAAPISEEVAVKTSCRSLVYSVKTEAGDERKTIDACQSADGAWQLG